MTRWLFVLIAAGCGCAVGCGEPTGTITGQVRFAGAPARAVVVRFVADDREYRGTTAADGRYEVPAVLLGSYRVTVLSTAGPPPSGPPPSSTRLDRDEEMRRGPKTDDSGPAATRLPDRLADPAASGLTLELREASQVFDIDLK